MHNFKSSFILASLLFVNEIDDLCPDEAYTRELITQPPDSHIYVDATRFSYIEYRCL